MRADIISAFQLTLIPDKSSIQTGTEALAALRKNAGFCLSLMEIADDAAIAVELRQAALAQLKLATEHRWAETERWKGQDLVQEPEKAEVRNYLYRAVIRCKVDNKFLKLYRAILRNVAIADYHSWLPTEEIANGLLHNPEHVIQILHFTMGIVEGFELSMGEPRLALSKLVVQVFPILFKLIQGGTPQTLFLITKICWKAFQMGLTSDMEKVSLVWIPLFCDVLKFYDEAFAKQGELFDRYSPAFYYFHAKKWAARTLFRFLSRHANSLFDKNVKQYQDLFYAKFSAPVKEALLYQLTVPTIPKTLYFILKGLQSYAEIRPDLLEPNVQDLLYVRLPAYLKLTPEDDELARNDPAEFFRKEEDPYQHFTNTKAASSLLWIALNKIGAPVGKDELDIEGAPGKYFMESMQYLKGKLSSANLLEKETAMFLVCKLRSLIMKSPEVKGLLPALIASYVVPEFSNPEMLLRAKAVDMFTTYGNIDFPDPNLLRVSVETIYKCLATDPNQIVRLKAACAFSSILNHKEAINMVKPFLNNILAEYVKLLDTFDNEDIIRSLENIISAFSDSIAPFAAELIRHLSAVFLKYCKIDHEKSKDDNYEGDVEMAASGCLNAISIILNAPIPTEVLPAIEDLLVPVFNFCLTQEGNDHFMDCVDCLAAYLYKAPVLNQRMWFYFPVIIYYVVGIGKEVNVASVQRFNESQDAIFSNLRTKRQEEVDLILPALRVYIYKGASLLLGGEKDFFGQSLLLLLVHLTDVIYQSVHVDEFEDINNQKATATALLTYLLEVISNKEELVAMTLNVVNANLNDDSANTNLQAINVQLLSMCIYRAPKVTIADLDKHGNWAKAFTSILGMQGRLQNDWQKKRFVLALSNLLRYVREASMLQLMTPLIKMAEKQIHLINMIREEELKEDSDSSAAGSSENDDDDDVEGMFWEEQHDTYYFDTLEDIDEVAYFEESIRYLQASDAEAYGKILSILTVEEQRSLQVNMTEAKSAFLKKRELRLQKAASGTG